MTEANAPVTQFVVMSGVRVPREEFGAAHAAAKALADATMSREHGCRLFRVHTPADGEPVVITYAIYDRRSDFEQGAGSHRAEWDALLEKAGAYGWRKLLTPVDPHNLTVIAEGLARPGPEGSGPLVCIGRFMVRHDHMDEVVEASTYNSVATMQTEAGCHLFRSHRNADGADEVMFYEIFTDAAAFAHHRTTPNRDRWFEICGPWVYDNWSYQTHATHSVEHFAG